MDSKKLVEACKNNDFKAQMLLYDKYVKAMYNVALRYVVQTDVAQDIVQESFIKVFKKINTYNGTVKFGVWLKRIVINQSIDYLKKRKLKLVSIDDKVFNIEDKSENWKVMQPIHINDIINGINQLQEKYKIILQLFLLEGYDHQEISEILNISQTASRTQLLRGKNKLKTFLNKNYHEKRHKRNS